VAKRKRRRSLDPAARYDELLNHGVNISKTKGYDKVTREEIAKQARCTGALIHHYFKTMGNLRKQIIKKAIEIECVEIILQALAQKDIKCIPEHLRDKVMTHLAK